LARQVRIVLQARTSSSRLAAKVLLPLAGLPLAILCARRLGSSGRTVILATSSERSDDMLALLAANAGVRVFRGSLTNVLDRFVQCVAGLNDDDLVVRATADNPLPNGRFVDVLLQKFHEERTDYLVASWPMDGLPYGLCAEVMTVAGLRRAAEIAEDPFDLEHVTPWLARQAAAKGNIRMGRLLNIDYSHLRATIDSLDDYLAMASAFTAIEDPVGVDWSQLILKLPEGDRVSRRVPVWRRNGESVGRITLGTVQLGLNYGVANRSGKPGDVEAAAILAAAISAGVTHLDTARAYGDSESRIGRLLTPEGHATAKLITKLQSWDSIPDDAPKREIRNAVDASVYGSCRDLRREQLDVLMFHRVADMFRWHGAAVDRLQELVAQGVIRALGVSVYAPGDVVNSLMDNRITHLQIPFNLLDSRWLDGVFAEALAQRSDVCVHVRSVFLQGLLINRAETWPSWVAQSQLFVERIERLVGELGRKSPADLCMAYVCSFPWVSTMVLGVETLPQLEELLSYAGEPALTLEQTQLVRSRFVDVPVRLLNPSLW
jgi:spore coat polysaccharide biosynthesis protein SpsF (cytidylyltransferase family)/aryl-alcohol dehydrogenase-like predicted oxidoreductase